MIMDGLQPFLSRFFFDVVDQETPGDDKDLLVQRVLVRKGMTELPEADEALLGEVFDGVVFGDPFQEEAEDLNMQSMVDLNEGCMVAITYSR